MGVPLLVPLLQSLPPCMLQLQSLPLPSCALHPAGLHGCKLAKIRANWRGLAR
jgi:hypothetical protein